ncbi:hypothetical protein BW716_06835 [[Flexibacter] sp. ATCC 35208]|nr:hypothetical protein BW716_06835 [[Flexibacter] sp. ATCC 35208]
MRFHWVKIELQGRENNGGLYYLMENLLSVGKKIASAFGGSYFFADGVAALACGRLKGQTLY